MKSTAWTTGVTGSWQDAANWTNGLPDNGVGDTASVLGLNSVATNNGTIGGLFINVGYGSGFINQGTINGAVLTLGELIPQDNPNRMPMESFANYGVIRGITAKWDWDISNEASGSIIASADHFVDISSWLENPALNHIGTLHNAGTIDADGGQMIVGNVTQTSSGLIEIENGGSLAIEGPVTGGLVKITSGHLNFNQHAFAGANGAPINGNRFQSPLELDGPADIAFVGGQRPITRLDFDPTANTLTVLGPIFGNDSPFATLHLAGTYTADEFAISPDGTHMTFTANVPTAPSPPADPPPVSPPAADPPPPIVAPPPAPPMPMHFSVLDTDTNTHMDDNGTAYTGPVSGLNWQYLNLSPANLNVASNVPNAFLHSGAGQDALDVSAANGTNVLDGSTGSNFLVGGTGADTFFLDDRNPSAALWSTLVNFHKGDSATVWGLTANDFQVQTLDGQGAGGFAGLTFNFTRDGQPTASLTLTGMTSADLSNGRLAMSYGRTGDLPGLSGSDYLCVHAA